ncbi:hypothetical protein BDM02DRAFT_3188488 [Thelephora ganbajun]|uniref:Uncharacterized protein n=1 Tax=Thelephora ganbajun TaxID=370292 RepID=A0ACB6ZB08_THEGA|nr:hypothetical protein BDM02DRAFT_3188488 [Thelephora ganbajun]
MPVQSKIPSPPIDISSNPPHTVIDISGDLSPTPELDTHMYLQAAYLPQTSSQCLSSLATDLSLRASSVISARTSRDPGTFSAHASCDPDIFPACASCDPDIFSACTSCDPEVFSVRASCDPDIFSAHTSCDPDAFSARASRSSVFPDHDLMQSVSSPRQRILVFGAYPSSNTPAGVSLLFRQAVEGWSSDVS